MTDPAPTPDDEPTAPPSLVPFAAALAVVVVVGVLAALFLRDDETGRLVRPDRLDAVGGDAVRAQVFELPGCERITRAQVDYEDDRLLVELVADDLDGCDGDDVRDVVAAVSLPQPIGERELVAGVGRTRLPCDDDGGGGDGGAGGDVSCGPQR